VLDKEVPPTNIINLFYVLFQSIEQKNFDCYPGKTIYYYYFCYLFGITVSKNIHKAIVRDPPALTGVLNRRSAKHGM
jgi:hypothetical protein